MLVHKKGNSPCPSCHEYLFCDSYCDLESLLRNLFLQHTTTLGMYRYGHFWLIWIPIFIDNDGGADVVSQGGSFIFFVHFAVYSFIYFCCSSVLPLQA